MTTRHPDFIWDSEIPVHDVAVVTFPPGTFAGVTPVKLPRIGRLDHLSKKKPLRLVAYGADPRAGRRLHGCGGRGLPADENDILRRVTRRHLKLKAGPCFDSGSPVFLGNTLVVAGTMTYVADDPCDGPFLSQRLDTRSEQRFLSQFVRLR